MPVTNRYLSAPEFKKEPTAAKWEMENNKAAKDAVLYRGGSGRSFRQQAESRGSPEAV